MRIILLFISLCISVNAFSAVIEGNPNGRVTMIEVFDYQCVYCHSAYPKILKLMDKNPDLKVRLMPVAILNQLSLYEAAAAITAANSPSKFQEFTNMAMIGNPLSENEITSDLNSLHLNSPDFKKQMHSKDVEDQLIQGLQFLRLEKASTPLFIIYPSKNPKISAVLKGDQKFSTLQKAISEAGEGA